MPEFFIKLQELFNDRYNKTFEKLNENIVSRELSSNNTYLVPVVTLGKGGGSISKMSSYQKPDAAKVDVSTAEVDGIIALYRMFIPSSECEIAVKDLKYFNFLFDSLLEQAMGNYNLTFGGPDRCRFGDFYVSGQLNFVDDSNIELLLTGKWANNATSK